MSRAQNLPSARKCPARLLGSGVYFLYQLFLRIWSIWASSWVPSGLWFESDFFCYFWTFCQWFFSTSLPLTAWTQQSPGSVSEQLWPFRPPRMLKLTVLVIGSIAVFALSPVGVKTFSQDIYLTLVSKMWKTPFVTLLWALSVVSPSSQLWACWWNLTHRIETRLQALHHFQITSLAFENTLWYLWP